MTEEWAGEYLQMVTDCENRVVYLTDWETGKIKSLREQLEKGYHLSQKDIQFLDNTWDKATKNG